MEKEGKRERSIQGDVRKDAKTDSMEDYKV